MDSKRYYDSLGEGYLDGHRTAAMRVVGDYELEFIASCKVCAPGSRTLEIGTGPGRLARHFALPHTSFVGLDISSEMLKACGRRIGPEALLVQCDASTGLPFVDAAFDFVYAIRSLKYTTDLHAALREAHRVLSPNGRLCFSIPNRRSMNSLYLKAHVPFVRTTRHEIEEGLTGLGFEVCRVSGGPKLPDAVYILENEKWGHRAAVLDRRLNDVFGIVGSRELYLDCRAIK